MSKYSRGTMVIALVVLIVGIASSHAQQAGSFNGLALGMKDNEVQKLIRDSDWSFIADDCDSTYISLYGWANLGPDRSDSDSITVIGCMNEPFRFCAASERTVVRFQRNRLSSITLWGSRYYESQIDSVRQWAMVAEQWLVKSAGRPRHRWNTLDTISASSFGGHGRLIAEWVIPSRLTPRRVKTVVVLSVVPVSDIHFSGIVMIMDDATYRKNAKSFRKR